MDSETNVRDASQFRRDTARVLAVLNAEGKPLSLMVMYVEYRGLPPEVPMEEDLCQFVEALRSLLGSEDLLARIGPNSFGVVLPESGTDAIDLFQRRLEGMVDADIPSSAGVPLVASIGTASCGSSSCQPGDLFAAARADLRTAAKFERLAA